MSDEHDEPAIDFGAAVNLWRTAAHRAMEEAGGDETAALILMRRRYDSDPALAGACEKVLRLIKLTNQIEKTMPKEAREIRGIIGIGPNLKLIQGGKA